MRPTITATDRLVLTVFLALAFHALLILGLTFTFQNHSKPTVNTLNITLVDSRSDQAPKNPDYIAQENQLGGGNTTKRVPKKTPETLPNPKPERGVSKTDAPPTAPAPPNPGTHRVLTRQQAEMKVRQINPHPKARQQPHVSAAQLIASSNREIARLEAETKRSWQIYSQRPDPKYLYANTRKAPDAAYLNYWTTKVQRIGNVNYPEAASRQGLTGSLVMQVVERPDGSVARIDILESSGHKVLDDAAIRIVRLAAPFAPVPANVLDGKNQLRIVRVWRFTNQNQLLSR